MQTLAFTDVTARAPDPSAIAAEVEELLRGLNGAADAATALRYVLAWDRSRREVDTWAALVELRFSQDTANADHKAARERWDEMAPRLTELEVEVKRALLDHALRVDLEAHLGAQVFALWEGDLLSFNPSIKDDLVVESKLDAEYTELIAGAEIEFRGETYNHSTLRRFKQDPDRSVRYGSELARWCWTEGRKAELDRIYDAMVAVRTKMARELGFSDFVGLAYKRMNRTDYERADVERFRRTVVDEVVPLCTELRRGQGQRLGLDRLMSWDEGLQDPAGNPEPCGDHDWMVERAREMFDEMGGGLGDFYRRMQDGGFLDLKSRAGKAVGGFCTSFSNCGMPFIFANFNGTKDDVEVFTHEMGHAFQNYQSAGHELSDYHWPTSDAAEVHSMSLEFLTWPYLNKFFGEGAQRFRTMHLTEALLFLPYGAAVDHFQHEVYADPSLSPDGRHALWREMEQLYLPSLNWGDLGYPAAGGRWQLQSHIYGAPFYYIDYVLAQTCALQFWVRAEHDRAEAMAAYVELCQRGGQAPFQELARSAGLTSPFDEGCLSEVVGQARRVLGV